MRDKNKLLEYMDQGYCYFAHIPHGSDEIIDWVNSQQDGAISHREMVILKPNRATLFRCRFDALVINKLDETHIDHVSLPYTLIAGECYEIRSFPDQETFTIISETGSELHFECFYEIREIEDCDDDVILYHIKGKPKNVSHPNQIVARHLIVSYDPFELPKEIVHRLYEENFLLFNEMSKWKTIIHNDHVARYRYSRACFEIASGPIGVFSHSNRLDLALAFDNGIQIDLTQHYIPVDAIVPHLISYYDFKPIAVIPNKDLFPDFEDCISE